MLLVSVGMHRVSAQGQPTPQLESPSAVVQAQPPTPAPEPPPAPAPELVPAPAPAAENSPAVQPPPVPKKKVVKVATVRVHGYVAEPTGLKTYPKGNAVLVPYTLVKTKAGSEKRFVYKRWGAWQVARQGNNDDRLRAIAGAKVDQEAKEKKADVSSKK